MVKLCTLLQSEPQLLIDYHYPLSRATIVLIKRYIIVVCRHRPHRSMTLTHKEAQNVAEERNEAAPVNVETNIPKIPCTALTIIISKIISPYTQKRERFSILGARKVKKNILLKVDRCSLVPNNLLKSSLVP